MDKYLLASLAVNSFYGMLIFRGGWDWSARLVLIGIGLISMVLFAAKVHKEVGGARVGESLRQMLVRELGRGLGGKSAVVTMGLIAVGLGLAVTLGNSREEAWMAAMEGVRTGVFLLLGLTVWRLSPSWRLATIAVWVGLDVWVYASAVVEGIGEPAVTLAVGIVTGWGLLRAQDALDRQLSGDKKQAT